jgi:hypothetical protein
MTIKVFAPDDIEWWAGESLEACLEEARMQAGDPDAYNDSSEHQELDDQSMQTLTFSTGLMIVPVCTFEEQLRQLIGEGTKFPCLFATTDY